MTNQLPNNKKFNKAHKITLQINKHFLLAWLLGIPFSYIMLGFLGNFYQSKVEFTLISFICHSLVTGFAFFLIKRIKREFQSSPMDMAIYMILAAVLVTFLISLVNMALKFPRLFNPSIYRIESGLLIYFFIGSFLTLPTSLLFFTFTQRRNFQLTSLVSFVENHLGGLLLAFFFFLLYLLIGSIFNQPMFRYIDIFFDTDVFLWRMRFATDDYQDLSRRSVHPFINILIRPLIALISVLLKGDTLYATYILIALTGSLCVFLVWYFVKQVTHNSLYSTLIAAVFGSSTSQLIFGSLIETYILLAATALIFIILLLKDKPQYTLVIMGLITFGITFLNFAHNVFAHLLVKRDIKQLIKYGLIVAVLVVPLNLVNNFIYPDKHPYIWDLSAYGQEEKHTFPPNFQRAHYLGRVMFLHSVVAPEPLLIKIGTPLLQVWLFRAAIRKAPMLIAEYEGWFSSGVAYLWFAFMLLGGVLFLKNLLRQDNRFFFTFILTLVFFFILHMSYGRDVFLYSANWTYAIFLFLALAWRELSDKRWFQLALLGFIPLLLLNNSRLILFMFTASIANMR